MNARWRRFDAGVLLALVVLGAAVPFWFSGYEIKLATTIAIQAGLAVALGFMVGPAGLVSLGHAMFYGVAGYLLAMVTPEYEPANLLVTASISILGAAALALVVGAVSIRARGLYFVLMTLAIGQLGYHFFHDTGWAGSADGRYINIRPQLLLPDGIALSLENPTRFYWLVFGVVVVSASMLWGARGSAFGSLLIGARDNEARVRAFGFSPYRLRLLAFVLSGAVAGAMGYLNAAQHGFVAPQLFGWHLSATVLVMVLIGGKDFVSGPAVGAILLLLAEEVLQRHSEHWLAGVGIIVMAVVLVAPRGILDLIGRLAGLKPQPSGAPHG